MMWSYVVLTLALLLRESAQQQVCMCEPCPATCTGAKATQELRGATFAKSTDVYLLMDETGTMKGAIGKIKASLGDLLRGLKTQPDIQFGFGTYRDDQTETFEHRQTLTAGEKAVIDAMEPIARPEDPEVSGWYGGLNDAQDLNEGNLHALNEVATATATIGWREGSRKFVVYVGDNPGHEPSCIGGPELTRETVGVALQDAGITLIAIDLGDNFDSGEVGAVNRKGLNFAELTSFMCGGQGNLSNQNKPGQANHLVDATDGTYVKSSTEGVVDQIKEAILERPKSFDIDDKGCEGKVTVSADQEFPLELSSTDERTIEFTLDAVKDSFGTCPTTFECTVELTESGGEVGQSVKFVRDSMGCSARAIMRL